MNLPDPLATPERIAICGDWHGNAVAAEHAIRWAAKQGVTTFLHAGDFGFWRPCRETSKYLDRVRTALEECGGVLLWVDGNHECFTDLYEYPVTENGLRRVRERIWHIPRGFRWEWHGKTWMGLGGAYSIDQQWRTPQVSWWPEEWITDRELEHASRPGTVDFMLTHDVPWGVDVPSLRKTTGEGWPERDVRQSDLHRKLLRTVVDAVKPTYLFHGHYHCRYDGILPLPDGHTVKVIGLDCDGSKMPENVVIVDLRDQQQSQADDENDAESSTRHDRTENQTN